MLIKAISPKTQGILLADGEKESWYHCSEAVFKFVSSLGKGTELEITESKPEPKGETIMRVSVTKKAIKEEFKAAAEVPRADVDRLRSMSFSYAKDLFIAGKNPAGRSIFTCSDEIVKYLATGEHPEQDWVFEEKV